MNTNDVVEQMIQRLELAQPVIAKRDARYRGKQKLRFTSDEVEGDLEFFSVNICRLAVNSVAERMRPKAVAANVGGEDVSARANWLWRRCNMDQILQSVLADALALGSAYLAVWTDRYGIPTITAESAEQVITAHDPVNNEVTHAVKRWFERNHLGAVVAEHVVLYEPDEVRHFVRNGQGSLVQQSSQFNPLGVVPVVPLINVDRLSDTHGHSVIDDLAQLVDALSKILADMIVASESVARPKRWAAGVELEEHPDGFMADDPAMTDDPLEGQAVTPFAEGNSMWTVESPDAKFGQLEGANLSGYRTAVDLILQQIMAVSALPAHMMGVTTSNPTSADAIRAAEASLTARAESRIRVLGLAIEQALRLMIAIDREADVSAVDAEIRWASPATRSMAQESDAVTKLLSFGVLSTQEAREKIGVDSL
ncbi:phage portal protein [Corynebacterium gerontici]|uniref:Phage portal protein, SPP1 Gp6-like n=1 Tax=Corynebacterium gerontici TaxID=2079234 RepID=A0A3G6IZK8_9CORY|nr:phage portal protein [Corynebacterium gerontici]AZA11086.1 Phage portal protein, SPP1 Gp6-like [Corynebacterium gerontici]